MHRSRKHAKSLPPALRSAAEAILGRPLEDDEVVIVRTGEPHDGSTAEQEPAAANLPEFLSEVDGEAGPDTPVEKPVRWVN